MQTVGISKVDVALRVDGVHGKGVFLGSSPPAAHLHLHGLHLHQLVEPERVAPHVHGGAERVGEAVVGEREGVVGQVGDAHVVHLLLLLLVLLPRVLVVALGHHVLVELAGGGLVDELVDDVADESAQDQDEQDPELHLILPDVGHVGLLSLPRQAGAAVRAEGAPRLAVGADLQRVVGGRVVLAGTLTHARPRVHHHVEVAVADGQAHVALQVEAGRAGEALGVEPPVAGEAVGVAVLGGHDQLLDAPEGHVGVSLRVEGGKPECEVGGVVGEGVLLDPHAVSGVAGLAVDVLGQVGVGVGGYVGGVIEDCPLSAEVLILEVGGAEGVGHVQLQVVSISPGANVPHVESHHHRVVVQRHSSVVLGQVVRAGVLAREGVVGGGDGGGAGGGEAGEAHGGGVGQFVGHDGPLGRQGAGGGRGPVGVQVEDVVGADHAARRGFVEADPLVVYAGGGAEVAQGGQRQQEQEECQLQRFRHVDLQLIIILIYSLCVKLALTINTDESHHDPKIKLKDGNQGEAPRRALLPMMALISPLKRVGRGMWGE